MKIKIECTIEVDADVIRAYIDDLGCDESIHQFVTTWILSGGIGSLEDSLEAYGDGYQTINITKGKYYG